MNAVFTTYTARASSMAKLSTCLKMVLFNRINPNSLSLLNHYCKFSISAMKFKLGDNALIENRTSTPSNKVKPDKSGGQKALIELKPSLFDKEIIKRRDEANRSILVQISSANLYEDLQNYCNQFGKISSIHYYEIKKDNYILIEYQHVSAVNEVMLHASFGNQDGIVSAKSPILWFRKGHFITSHNRKNNQKRISTFINNNLTYPNENDIEKLLRDANSISAQMISLYDILKLDDLEIRLRFHTACYLEKYFSGLFQNMKVLPFGSSVNGFGKKKCDIDLVIVPDDIKHNVMNRLIFHTKPIKRNERQEIKEFLGTVASAMQCFIPGIKNIRRILEARVPIIKFYYEYTQLECDLSLTNMTAIYMSELLHLYGEIDWRVRPLVIAIRQWAKSQKITYESPGPWITNFSLTLLVLFYLQQKKILPSLNILKMCATSDEIRFAENGIDCSFLRNINRLPAEYMYKINQDNLEDLLQGFFEYYGKFDFQTKAICIRKGVPIRKPTCAALYIINPLETNLNVSKNLNIYELNRITQKVHEALYLLKTTNKSIDDHWGFMALLNKKISSTINFDKIKEEIQDSSEFCHNYYEVNENDIARSEVQKKNTKEIV